MSRPMLKRPRDAFDSSPASSTPPRHPTKRFHIDSDASSDAFAFHLPSDSPSNPFSRFKPFIPRDLPQATPKSDHLVLRFQLGQQAHSVYRVVAVPANYTFWHLHRLAQFLFGWKDIRKEKNPRNKSQRIERRTEHIFTVQKRVVFYTAVKHAGLFKNGSTVLHVAGNIKELRPRCNDDVPWEREECYTLGHLWHRPGSTSDMSRAIIYEYDVLSLRKEAVYISMYGDSDKLKSTLLDNGDLNNTPLVILGSGLPDDDDDDEDFALDLQQWNELHAFENFMLNLENGDEESDDDCPSTVRLAEEQALVKKRMSAPLPRRLPLDEDQHEDAEEDVPPTFQMLTTKVAAITVPKPEKQRTSATQGVRLPDPDESVEVGVNYPTARELSPVKKRSSAADVHLPDPEESCEIGADYNIVRQPQLAPRKRMPLAPRLPDPEESCEIGADYAKEPRKRMSLAQRLPDPESREIGVDYPDVPQPAPGKRMLLEPRLPDPEESREIGADVPQPALRKRIPFAPRLPSPEESREIGADYPGEPRKRVVLAPHFPDPDESREIGDDRPLVREARPRRESSPTLNTHDLAHVMARKPAAHFCLARQAPMHGAGRHAMSTADAEEVDELESEVEV